MIWLKYKKRNKNILTPKYAHEGDSGFDLAAAFPDVSYKTIYPNEIMLIPTGLFFEIPYGNEGQVRSRSGLAIKHGITVVNAPGTIDSNYRGEVCVGLLNVSERPFKVVNEDRIAQMVIAPVEYITLTEQAELAKKTERGEDGFGSSGYRHELTGAIRGND